MNKHEMYMKKAIALAKKGKDAVYPNPRVGAVIVKNNRIIAQGFHAKYGQPHAEKIAIDMLTSNNNANTMSNAILYCTLEPCCGIWKGKKQAPCTNTIIASGIKEVVVGMVDPNPKVQGKGIAILQKAGIKVTLLNAFQRELIELNEVFITLQHEKRPFVHAKIAQSLDAQVASSSGDSQWITGEASRYMAHRTLRKNSQVIITGINTILKDNPRLDVRLNNTGSVSMAHNNPVVVVLDTKLQIPVTARLFDIDRRQSPGVIIFCAEHCIHQKKVHTLEKKGVKVIPQKIMIDKKKPSIHIVKLLNVLYAMSLYSVLLEGGTKLISSFISMGLVDKISVFIAPKIIGTTKYRSLQISGANTMKDIYPFYAVKTHTISNPDTTKDMFISGYTKDYFTVTQY